jgi:hypothetical protein
LQKKLDNQVTVQTKISRPWKNDFQHLKHTRSNTTSVNERKEELDRHQRNDSYGFKLGKLM